MRSVSVRLADLRNVMLPIGFMGENLHTQVQIDCKKAFEQYPNASVTMAVTPPMGESYPGLVTRDGDMVIWDVTDSDLVADGDGEIQLTFTEGQKVKKSYNGRTRVYRSIMPTGNVPTGVENWLIVAGNALNRIVEAEVNQPVIINGNWCIWNMETGAYQDTGIQAQGVGISSIEKTGTSGLVDTYTITYTNGNSTTYTVTNGRDGQTVNVIDDTSTAADKAWSASKVSGEFTEVKGDILSLDNAVFEEVPEDDQLVNVPLSFSSYGWWSSSRYYDTQDGKKAEVSVSAGEKYDVKGKSIWSFAPYVVLDAENNILLSGAESGSGSYTNAEATITIPSGGVKLVFSAEANNTNWQNYCKCVKHIITYKKQSRLIVEKDNQENIPLSWTDGKAYLSNGNALVDGGYSYDLVEIVPGDTYTFKYYSQWTITYVVFDADMTMLSHGEVSNSATWASYEATVTMPSSAKYLALSITSYRPSSQVTESYLHHYYKEQVNLSDYILSEVTKGNILWGKKWFATGDSFTHGSIVDPDEDPFFESGIYMGKRKTYPYFIGLRNNMTIINDGLSGSTMAEIKSGDSYETKPFCDVSRYQSIPEDVDYITLWFGINDANHCNLGTISDNTTATFYGAWNVVLTWIITNRPNAKIGIVITNLSTDTFREATREIAQKFGIPYLDMMGDYQTPVLIGGRESNLNMDSDIADLRTAHFRIASDNNHPTVAAHRYESTFIEAFLRRL